MHLPSTLHSSPALRDETTSNQQLQASTGKVTNPDQTPIFICAFTDCHRLFPSRERVMLHRRRDHTDSDPEDNSRIITWNAS